MPDFLDTILSALGIKVFNSSTKPKPAKGPANPNKVTVNKKPSGVFVIDHPPPAKLPPPDPPPPKPAVGAGDQTSAGGYTAAGNGNMTLAAANSLSNAVTNAAANAVGNAVSGYVADAIGSEADSVPVVGPIIKLIAVPIVTSIVAGKSEAERLADAKKVADTSLQNWKGTLVDSDTGQVLSSDGKVVTRTGQVDDSKLTAAQKKKASME